MRNRQYFARWNYAHRGLHDPDHGIPENSLAAFEAAAVEGYGVELDVQLSGDGKVVVFHDSHLKRVCGVDRMVSRTDLDELKTMRLLGTNETVPLLTEALEVLRKGSGPLIVELKPGESDKELCEKTYGILKDYDGAYCIESFHPLIVNWFRKNAPEVIRGQLAAEKELYTGVSPLAAAIASQCRFSFLNKPDFIAYHNIERPKRILKLREKGILLFGWTSRKPDIDQVLNDSVIFEGYRPQPRF